MHFALRAGVVAVGLGSLSLPASAVPHSNWYFSMSALSSLSLDDGEFEVVTPPSGSGGPLNFPLLSTTGIGVTPGSTQTFDASYDEDDDAMHFAIGRNFRQRYRLELFAYSESVSDIEDFGGANASGELRIETYGMNAWYDFFSGSSIQPYIGIGVAQSQVSLGDISDDATNYQVGVGISWTPLPILTLDLGYRQFETEEVELEFSNGQLNSEFDGNAVLLSARFNFFADRPARSYDSLPASPAAASDDCGPGSCSDIDQDGLTDDKDQCPNTPPGTPVNIEGCADNDVDGVADVRDLCPDTPRGSPVMANGCAAKQSTILQGVNFEFGTDRLTQTAKRILERTANALKESPNFSLDIIGHTDAKGSQDFNQNLSELRAHTVAAYLHQQGISYDRLRAIGKGEIEPLADNSSAEGRATNRRVEIRVRDYK